MMAMNLRWPPVGAALALASCTRAQCACCSATRLADGPPLYAPTAGTEYPMASSSFASLPLVASMMSDPAAGPLPPLLNPTTSLAQAVKGGTLGVGYAGGWARVGAGPLCMGRDGPV